MAKNSERKKFLQKLKSDINKLRLDELLSKMDQCLQHLNKDMKAKPDELGNEMSIEETTNLLDDQHASLTIDNDLLEIGENIELYKEKMVAVINKKADLIVAAETYKKMLPPTSELLQKKCTSICGEALKLASDFINKNKIIKRIVSSFIFKDNLKLAQKAYQKIDTEQMKLAPDQKIKELDKRLKDNIEKLKTLITTVQSVSKAETVTGSLKEDLTSCDIEVLMPVLRSKYGRIYMQYAKN